ncbi:hypothetical protein BH20ACI3_BH20ACI3_08830 [soil metagenome]
MRSVEFKSIRHKPTKGDEEARFTYGNEYSSVEISRY